MITHAAKKRKSARGGGASQSRQNGASQLGLYRHKRNFSITPEPAGQRKAASNTDLQFVIQKHDASHLHYDFRLEFNGVLKSWAVPKGPSLDPARKSLAIEVEDHPIEYGSFEGTIPEGQYGGGTVMLWDHGTWEPIGDADEGFKAGKLHFLLHGQKLQGEWNLVRMRPRPGEKKSQWLLMKIKDEYADSARDILAEASESVKTGRSLEQIAGNGKDVWDSQAPRKVSDRPKADKVEWPPKVSPQLAVLADHPPEGDQWLHEIKFDGYRLLAYIAGGEVRLMTRNEQDWTHKFPAVAKALSTLKVKSAIIDGEVVVLDAKGHSDFQALQAALKDGKKASPILYVFDLLYEDGADLRAKPLVERKAALNDLLKRTKLSPYLRYSDHVRGNGEQVIKKACGMALEGILSKRSDAPYVSRRDPSWLKSKCTQQQEMVIVGYTDPEGSRQGFGSLLLGYHDDQHRLVYAGRVGTGFDEPMLRKVHGQLQALEQKTTGLDVAPPARERRAAHWVQPKLVAEIRFSNWTRNGMLRHPAFIALRSDKPAEEITREIAIHADQAENEQTSSRAGAQMDERSGESPVKAKKTARGAMKMKSTPPMAETANVPLTHPDKILYADKKITKRDVAEYYTIIQPWMLPHVINRPLTLLRCPGGTSAKCFFQRNWTETLPEALHQANGKGGADHHLLIEDFAGLMALVQINAMEIHTWNCHENDIEHPDQLVFDLDPGPDVSWKHVVDGALQLKKALDQLKLPTFLKTSGGKGLHITIPIKPNIDWGAGKSFCEQVAKSLVQQSDLFVANMRKDLRAGKIYIDYQRNGQSATAIAPYSTRARAGAAVSMPISWKELAGITSAMQFAVDNAARYLAKRKQDPWSDFETSRVDLRRIAGQT